MNLKTISKALMCISVFLLSTTAFALPAGPVLNMDSDIEDAVEDAGDSMEDATEGMEDAVEDGAEGVEDAAEDAADEMD